MLSPECKKGHADVKPVDPDEIISLEISQISSSIDYLELITPTSYKITLKFLDTVLASDNDGVFDMISERDKIYHLNLSYSLISKSDIGNLITDLCNNPMSIEFFKIFDANKIIKIGQNQIHSLQAIYENSTDFEDKLEFLQTVPVLNIKPVYFNYTISCNNAKLDFGWLDNFITISVTIPANPIIADSKIGLFYPVNEKFYKTIFLNDENKFQFVGFINENNRKLLLECGLNDQCIAIELKTEANHYIGFLEMKPLLEYETNFNQNVLLFEFNWNALKAKCSKKESIFKTRENISEEKKSNPKEKPKKKKGTVDKKPPSPAAAPVPPAVLVPVYDEEKNQISIEINLLFKKPLIFKQLNPHQIQIPLLAEDEQEDDTTYDIFENDAIQSLILTQDINPQQMKDHLISVILPLWDKKNIFNESGNNDRRANLITFYFKLKQLISAQYLKFVLPQKVNTERLDKDLLFMAKEFHIFGRFQQANQFYLMYLKEKEFSEDSLLDYIAYNLKIHDFERVRLCCQRLLKINESNVLGLLIQSYIHFKLSDFILCERILLKICKIAPGSIHALVILFLLQIRTEKYSLLDWIAKEITKSEKCPQCNSDHFETNNFEFCWAPPNSCDTFFTSAVFFINLGCFAFAEIALSYNQLIQDNLRNDRLYLLSIIDFEQRNYKTSLVHFKMYRLSHQTIYKFKFNLLFHLEDYANCYEFYQNSIEAILWTVPPKESRQFYLKLAWHFVNTEKFNEAKLLLDKIPEECSTYMYWITLGKCFVGLAQLPEAEGCFIKANIIDKLSKEPWLCLIDTYEQMGQKPQAALCRGNLN